MVVGVLAMSLVHMGGAGHDSYISMLGARRLPAISSPGDGSKIKMLATMKVTAAYNYKHRWQGTRWQRRQLATINLTKGRFFFFFIRFMFVDFYYGSLMDIFFFLDNGR